MTEARHRPARQPVRRWPLRAVALLVGVSGLLLLHACSDERADPVDDPPTTSPQSWTFSGMHRAGSCSDGSRVVRALPWPGGGVQVILQPDPASLAAAPSAHNATVTVNSGEGGSGEGGSGEGGSGEGGSGEGGSGEGSGPAAVDKVNATTGLTGLVVVPGQDEAEHKAVLEAALSLAKSLPKGEQIAIWRVADAPQLQADLTRDLIHIERRISRLSPTTKAPAPLAAKTVAGLQLALKRAAGPYGPVHRDLVLIQAQPPTLFADDEKLRVDAVGRWWLTATASGDSNAHDGAGWAAIGGAQSGKLLAQRLRQRRDTALRVGACVAVKEDKTFQLQVADTTCSVTAPAPMEHMKDVACEASAATSDAYPYPRRLDFSFDKAGGKLHKDYADKGIKEDFPVAVQLGAGAPIPAKAHLRGHSSLACARKSYTVNLEGSERRRWTPGASGDEFHLLSLCLDDRYFRTALSYTLLAEMDLFRLNWRFVRLFIDGSNHGVYLMVEHHTDTIVGDQMAVRAVIRRRFDPADEAEDVKHPDGNEAQANATKHYSQVEKALTAAVTQDSLAEVFDALDVQGYLDWLAFNSIMRVGDSVDEAFFIATQEAGDNWYFRAMPWDIDDLFSPCHHQGKFALQDPNSLMYCLEGDIDKALLVSKPLYALFAASLQRLLDEALTAERLKSALASVRQELWQVLVDDETAKAMIALQQRNPRADTLKTSRQDIAKHMDLLLAAAQDRRKVLVALLKAWKNSVD